MAIDASTLPGEFLREIRALLGEETGAFLHALEEDSVHALRINSLKPGAFAAAETWASGPVPWEPLGRYVKQEARPGAAIEHAAGAYYMQDASAMAAVAALAPQPGWRVLDLCAAPGGKSGQIAARLDGSGLLISNEIDRGRCKVLKSNLERLGAANVRVTNLSPADFSGLENAFDALLVDAPCSGEGMFRRDAGALQAWSPALPEACAVRQAKILDCAAPLLRPGGRLVYSTCTFNRAENECSIEAFLKRHPDFVPDDFSLPGIGQSQNGCLRLWPHRLQGEGHFVCRLKRLGEAAPLRETPLKPDKQAREALKLLEDVCALPPWEGACILEGDALCFVPQGQAGLKELPGASRFVLARVGRGFIEPSHALSMALPPECARRTLELTPQQASLFLQGETLDAELPNGWTLMLYKKLPLGWGKTVNGTVKNHLPKGLRLRGGHAIEV